MRCPHIHPGLGISYCNCGTYPSSRGIGHSKEVPKEYVINYCLNNSLACPYNPERNKFSSTTSSFGNQANYNPIEYNQNKNRLNQSAKKGKSKNELFFWLIVIFIAYQFFAGRF